MVRGWVEASKTEKLSFPRSGLGSLVVERIGGSFMRPQGTVIVIVLILTRCGAGAGGGGYMARGLNSRAEQKGSSGSPNKSIDWQLWAITRYSGRKKIHIILELRRNMFVWVCVHRGWAFVCPPWKDGWMDGCLWINILPRAKMIRLIRILCLVSCVVVVTSSSAAWATWELKRWE